MVSARAEAKAAARAATEVALGAAERSQGRALVVREAVAVVAVLGRLTAAGQMAVGTTAAAARAAAPMVADEAGSLVVVMVGGATGRRAALVPQPPG